MTVGIEVTLSGPFFTKDVTRTIDQNTNDAVKWLVERGTPLVRGQLRSGIKDWSGFTAAAMEDTVLPPKIGHGSFGVVWMRAGLSRGGSRSYSAARVPYIINAVLESGNYAGHPRRKHVGQFRQARAAMRHMAARINVDLTKGL
jgi:hypothetical protein